MLDMPDFMLDDTWYYFDYEERKYKLTPNAPEGVKESYIEYEKDLKKAD